MKNTVNETFSRHMVYLKKALIKENINDEWFDQGSFSTYKKPAVEKYEIAAQDGTLKTLEGEQQYKAGYYILTGPKGEKYSMPPEKFRELKDDLGNGECSPKKIMKVAKLADHDGSVNTSWGAKLDYTAGNDYIVKHGSGDYGVVKKDIFDTTYVKTKDLEEGWKDWVAAGAIGLSALKGGNVQAAAPNAKPAITKTVQSDLDQSFVDYIKSVENAGRAGYNKNKKLWFPHKSFEGGSDTIGYGHKIQSGEDFSKGITDSQAESLLKKDLRKAAEQVKKEVGNKQLTKKQMEMFVDFVFNMGTLKKFPKFTQAALKNDANAMKSQYKRYSGGKELKGRNSAFLQRFLTEYFA